MKRVLIWKKVSPGSEYDIYRGLDTLEEYKWRETFNVGNRLWFQGLMSAIDLGENEYSFLTTDFTVDRINNEYDFIILPMANIFNSKFRHWINGDTFKKIRIPVYVIACGAQADNYESIDLLIDDIGDVSKGFIDAVYATGGEFALRGNFTKEFFNRLGYTSAVVTGCPSMYQMGRDFVAEGCKPHKASEKPVFHGNISALKDLMVCYRESFYIDQDAFWRELYDCRTEKVDFRKALSFYCNNDSFFAYLLSEDRIRLVPDTYNWSKFLQNSQIDYSFGSRIHGSIMAILSGIPATVLAVDTRTQEMAEFFDIPHIMHSPGYQYSAEELSEFYRQANYEKFNQTYREKYSIYEQFLVENGIVSKVNENNMFFSSERRYIAPPTACNVEYYKDMHKFIRRNKFILDFAKKIIALRR